MRTGSLRTTAGAKGAAQAKAAMGAMRAKGARTGHRFWCALGRWPSIARRQTPLSMRSSTKDGALWLKKLGPSWRVT